MKRLQVTRLGQGVLNEEITCDPCRPPLSHLLVKGSSDADLVAAVLAGDVEAFSGLVRRHEDACVRFAVRMLGSRADADDALQSAFMRAFRGLRSCREPDCFRGGLFHVFFHEGPDYSTRT